MKAIEYQSVSKKYSGSSGYSVDNVSTTIDEGEFVTILGSSGCGKTTLLKMTNRLIDPTEGKIVLFGGICHPAGRPVPAYDDQG